MRERWRTICRSSSSPRRAELEAWLEENHAGSPGLWLKIAKKGSGVESVSYAQALELALCFGWIDSQKRGFDERHLPAALHAAAAARQVVADQPREGGRR